MRLDFICNLTNLCLCLTIMEIPDKKNLRLLNKNNTQSPIYTAHRAWGNHLVHWRLLLVASRDDNKRQTEIQEKIIKCFKERNAIDRINGSHEIKNVHSEITEWQKTKENNKKQAFRDPIVINSKNWIVFKFNTEIITFSVFKANVATGDDAICKYLCYRTRTDGVNA